MSKFLTALQLSDSAFPTGGFAHSLGLEAVMKHKKINNTDDLLKFAVCSMENAGSFNIPFVKAAYEAVDEPTFPEVIDNPKMSHPSQESILRLIDLDNTCEACLSNHIANRASSRQGRSMLDTTYKATELHLLGSIQALIDENKLEGHHPVIFGYICSVLGVGKQEAIEMYMFGVLRCIVASAVRLSIIGPLQGQSIQYKLQQLVPSILKRNQKRCVEDAVITSPIHRCHTSKARHSLFKAILLLNSTYRGQANHAGTHL